MELKLVKIRFLQLEVTGLECCASVFEKKKKRILVIPPHCEASVMQFYRYLNLFLPSE